MTDYTELIHALRYCADRNRPDCSVCEYEAYGDCDDKIKRDAAAAIEALQAEVERLEPKRGEWILQASGQDCKCSACESYWIPFGDEYDYKFCPNCGAKMEVQDGANRGF